MLRNILISGTAGIAGTIIVLIAQGQPFHLAPANMSYADLAATLLGASAVLLAIIGVFVAALAIWGFTAFRDTTKASAKQHVDDQLREGELRGHIEKIVSDFLTKEFAGGNLRKLVEERVEAILLSSAGERAKESDASESDASMEHL